MLQEVCEYIHNYFIPKDNGLPRVWHGDFTIVDGVISPAPALKDGQKFMIAGSDLNDGVYTFHEAYITDDDDTDRAGLRAETFTGSIAAMAVPPTVIAIAGEIKDWADKYGSIVNSPYQSETFQGVYGYTKAAGNDNNGGGWQNVFGKRLERWRKPCLM